MENCLMGLNRRKFTREFKEAAVRRLELGASVAEVSRACEVNPNVLHRWRRELREFGTKALPDRAVIALMKIASLRWNEKWASRRWRSIFYGDACSMSRSSGGCRH